MPVNEQYMAALAKANRIRTFRAQMKRDIKAGRVDARGVIAAPYEDVQTMHVYDLLRAVPYMGRIRADKLLRRCSIAPSKTVGGLSERQRKALLHHLWQEGHR